MPWDRYANISSYSHAGPLSVFHPHGSCMYIIQRGRTGTQRICRAACSSLRLNSLLMSPGSHLGGRLLPSSSLFPSVNSTVALFNHETLLLLPPPLFFCLTHLLFSNSQLLSAGDTHTLALTYSGYLGSHMTHLPQIPVTSLQPASQPSLIVCKYWQVLIWYRSRRGSRWASFTYTSSQKLGQRGFEGHPAVKWLFSA